MTNLVTCIVLIAVVGILLLQWTDAIPLDSVGGAMVIAMAVLVGTLAVAIHEGLDEETGRAWLDREHRRLALRCSSDRPLGSMVMVMLDANPEAMRQRRETVEHPFGTMKASIGGDALPHKNASQSSRRDGALGSGLQSDTGHEHYRHQAADRCDRSLRDRWFLALRTDLPTDCFLHGQDPTRTCGNST